VRFGEGLFDILMANILIASAAIAHEVPKKDNDAQTKDLADNRKVRLVGGVIGQTPGQNLGAKFVEIEPTGSMAGDFRTTGKEFAVRFPAHSHTTHETTLMNIIYSAVPLGKDPYKPREPQFEVIFSIPKDAQERVPDFDRWYLDSIKPLEAKKEPPQDAEKAMPGAGQMPINAGPQNRAVQLVGLRFTEDRRHERIWKFAEVGRQQGGEFELGIPRNWPTCDQTLAEVAHTRTILTIIVSSFVSDPLLNPPRFDATGRWREPRFEVVFSIPQDAQGNGTDFTRWSLISIKLPSAKQEQPKPADK